MMFRDPSLPHQITLHLDWRQRIAVGCNCGAQLGARSRWDDPREPARLWRAHMATTEA